MKAALVVSALALSACSTTIGAVNPRPNVVVAAQAPSVGIDVGKVADVQQPKGESSNGVIYLSHVTIRDFRQTLRNGFRNAVASTSRKTRRRCGWSSIPRISSSRTSVTSAGS